MQTCGFLNGGQLFDSFSKYFVSSDRFLKDNSSVTAKNDETEGGISKESIAQANLAPTTAPSTNIAATPTASPTASLTATPSVTPTGTPSVLSTTGAPELNKVEVNKSENTNPWAHIPEEKSIDEARKPDLNPFRDEVEEDAVIAENEADKQALLNEVAGTKANKTEAHVDEESDDAISEEIPSSQTDLEALNVRPPRPRLVTPFRGRCPVCRKYPWLCSLNYHFFTRVFVNNLDQISFCLDSVFSYLNCSYSFVGDLFHL